MMNSSIASRKKAGGKTSKIRTLSPALLEETNVRREPTRVASMADSRRFDESTVTCLELMQQDIVDHHKSYQSESSLAYKPPSSIDLPGMKQQQTAHPECKSERWTSIRYNDRSPKRGVVSQRSATHPRKRSPVRGVKLHRSAKETRALNGSNWSGVESYENGLHRNSQKNNRQPVGLKPVKVIRVIPGKSVVQKGEVLVKGVPVKNLQGLFIYRADSSFVTSKFSELDQSSNFETEGHLQSSYSVETNPALISKMEPTRHGRPSSRNVPVSKQQLSMNSERTNLPFGASNSTVGPNSLGQSSTISLPVDSDLKTGQEQCASLSGVRKADDRPVVPVVGIYNDEYSEDDALRKVLEMSRRDMISGVAEGGGFDDDELRRAMALSQTDF